MEKFVSKGVAIQRLILEQGRMQADGDFSGVEAKATTAKDFADALKRESAKELAEAIENARKEEREKMVSQLKGTEMIAAVYLSVLLCSQN